MGEVVMLSGGRGGGGGGKTEERQRQQQQGQQVLDLVLAALRKSVALPCQVADADDPAAPAWGMEIGWPTDVRHVAHVTFDRLQGFLGLPVEFELEIPVHVPSASASVFGVSPESMQCGYDEKGNSIPKILLLMQERLYLQNGLKSEGIFRITPENSQEERVREQLNRGVVPDDIDVHCLASLIKWSYEITTPPDPWSWSNTEQAWFRELPEGVLDSLSTEEVLDCNTEEQCVELVKLLPSTQAALLCWVVELMADVVEVEESNKMNTRNIAMVFAPNMTQMADPLTALMHAVQVMNLLKTLILKTLRERGDDDEGSYSTFSSSSSLSDDTVHYDQQHDDNDTGINKCYGDINESPDHIDKDAMLKVDNDHLIGASRRHTSFEFHLPDISYSSDGEDPTLNDIEEGFLRRLEWQEVSKDADEGDGCEFLSSNKQAKQSSSTENLNGTCKVHYEQHEDHETSKMEDPVSTNSTEQRQPEIRNEITSEEVKDDMERELILCS